MKKLNGWFTFNIIKAIETILYVSSKSPIPLDISHFNKI
jgi:hypothetical protein